MMEERESFCIISRRRRGWREKRLIRTRKMDEKETGREKKKEKC
jgi:hypothetical protein